MTIKECIDLVDGIKPNQYTIREKVMWLSFIEGIIINEILKTHEGYDGKYDLFEGYSEDKLSVALIVPTPYDRLYTEFLKMKIDEANGETARYNNSMVLFNSYMDEYRKHYNKTHMPLDPTSRRAFVQQQKAQSVGLTDAEYENIKKDLTYIMTEYFGKKFSEDKISDIVNTFVCNNIAMLKGKDGRDGIDGKQGEKGDKGDQGEDGVGITSISCYENTESGGINQVNVSMSDGYIYNFYIRNGEKGEKGDKGDMPTVPTNISAFTNDSGYITKAEIPRKSKEIHWVGSNEEISGYSLDIENNNVYQIQVSGGWKADVFVNSFIVEDNKFNEFFMFLNADLDGTIEWETEDWLYFVYNKGERLIGDAIYTTEVKAGAHLYHGYANWSNETIYITDLYEPLKTSELTNDSGYITSTVQNVESIDYFDSLESNKVYRITTDSPQIVWWPDVDSNIQNQILIYLNATAAIDIVWGDDVVFVNDEIPTIGVGHYRIIFEFNPILAKWVVGVIQDGAVN